MKSTSQVYISSTRKDKALATQVANVLSGRGFRVWAQSDAESSDSTIASERALKESDSMIALLSAYSYSSSYVRSDIEHALFDDRYKDRILPVLLGRADQEFFNIPWVVNRLKPLRLYSKARSARGGARDIADAFAKLLETSGAE